VNRGTYWKSGFWYIFSASRMGKIRIFRKGCRVRLYKSKRFLWEINMGRQNLCNLRCYYVRIIWLLLNLEGLINSKWVFPLILVVPLIKEKPKITKIVKKKTVVIECKVQSSFTPKCTWFKETKAVKEDTQHTVHIEQIREVIIIPLYNLICVRKISGKIFVRIFININTNLQKMV